MHYSGRDVMWKYGIPIATVLASLVLSAQASAFCRSTTCRATGTKECPKDENDCPSTGEALWWPTACISYATNRLGTQDLDPDDTRAIIRQSFMAWSDVPCGKDKVASMTFQEVEPIACKKSQYNKTGMNVNVVLFQDDDWKYRGIDGTLAKTSVTYNDETGEIYDADIEVNTANNTVTITDDPAKVEYDLQAILTHEVGHFIGIAHSPEGSAVMYASYSPGSVSQRKLSPDDVKAVCTIFPPNSGVTCDTVPRGGFSPTCDEPEQKSCSVAAAGAAAHAEDASPKGTTAAMSPLLGIAMLSAVRLARRRRLERDGTRGAS